MNSYEFTIPFKGAREYIHGTDIISCIESVFKKNVKKFKINFTDVIKTNFIKIVKDQNNINKKVKSKFSINEEDYHIIELGKNEIIQNKRYDEHLATEGYTLSDKTIKIKKNFFFTEIETIVALNKILLDSIFFSKDFWFVNLEINIFPISFHEVELKYSNSLFKKFHETKIYIDNNFVGHLRFQDKI
jgi:hypothetical protein